MESFGKSDADSDKESQLTTPDSDWDCDTFVACMKEQDARSLSSSSWDLEPESVVIPFANFNEGVSVNVGVEGPSECIQLKEDYLDLEKEKQYGSYDELLKKFIKNEEELRVSNYKLEHSEEEIAKLKIQIEQCEGQLDDVQKELKQKDGDLEYEKGQVLEMQKQKAELRDCCNKFTKVEEMLEMVANEQLKISSNEIARLTKELESKLSEIHELQGQLKVAEERVTKLECEFDSGRKQIQDLEERITWYKANESKLELEVQNLKKEFTLEKDKVYCDIQSLSKTNEDLTSTINEYENKLRQCAIANMKQEELHAALQMALKGEIDSLKEEVGQRKHDVEAVKKEFEMVVSERQEANAQIDILKAEMISREDQFRRLKSNIASNSLYIVKDFVLRVEKLEREVTIQKDVISNLKVEKEKVIRQVEYYRTKHQQLVQQESSDDRSCLFFQLFKIR